MLRIKVEGFSTILTNLIGIEDGLYLIIKTPPIPEIGTKLFQKNNIVISYLYAGQVFGFRTTLLGLINDPFRFSIISYPSKVEKVNIRKHERVVCMLPAQLQLQEDVYEILIEDISIGGCYFEVFTSKDGKFPLMTIGKEALLSLSLPGISDGVTLNIIVRTIKCDIRTMKIGAQIKQSETEGADMTSLAAINNYIATCQTRGWVAK